MKILFAILAVSFALLTFVKPSFATVNPPPGSIHPFNCNLQYRLYDNVGYGGGIYPAFWSQKHLGSVGWNDRASSLRVDRGMVVDFYSDNDFGGGWIHIDARNHSVEVPNIGAAYPANWPNTWNDAISSVVVETCNIVSDF